MRRIELEVLDLSDASGSPLRVGTLVKSAECSTLVRGMVGDNNANGRLDVGDATVILAFLTRLEQAQ